MAYKKVDDHLKEKEKNEAMSGELEKKNREIEELMLENTHLKIEMENLKAINSMWRLFFLLLLVLF